MTRSLNGPYSFLPGSHLWIASFDSSPRDSQTEMELDLSLAQLSDRDLDRWRRFRPSEKKRQFLESRIAIRAAIAAEFGRESQNIQLGSNSVGCPLLLHRDGRPSAFISISHSGSIVAIAVSRQFSVGVDIETARPIRTDSIRPLIVNSVEAGALDVLGGEGITGRLRAVWVAKEAVWKALGGPIELSVSEISIDWSGDAYMPKIIHPQSECDAMEITLFVPEGEDCSAAGLCCERLKLRSSPFIGCLAQRMVQNQQI